MKPTNANRPLPTIFTLPNGLRCVHARALGRVNYIGIVINAGSRCELPSHYGLAHFVEHTIFKGTMRRKSYHISNRMESVGGELNAYTSKEETVIYTNAPAGYTARSLELISDLIANSYFPKEEIDREKDVVIEEIKSYLDSPCDSVYDEFDELIYDGSPMAHNILGSTESVKKLDGTDCRHFLDDFYTPDNMVLYIVDDTTDAVAERLANKYFAHLHLQSKPRDKKIPPMNPTFFEMRNRNGHQAHTIMGVRAFDRNDDRRFPLFLLNNYLGGPCMNSRLNQEMRDKRGYVYTVDSTLALMSDCGLLQIYFGSDINVVPKCKKLVIKEMKALAAERIKEAKFNRIKQQYVGQLEVSTDQRESAAMSLAKSVLYYGAIHDADWTRERILAITADEVRDVAELLLKRQFSELTLY